MVGVEQGFVLAPVLFKVYLVTVSLLPRKEERWTDGEGVSLRYHFEGVAINLQ